MLRRDGQYNALLRFLGGQGNDYAQDPFSRVLPSGSLGLDEEVAVPVVGIPRDAALETIRALRRGAKAALSIGALRVSGNDSMRRVAVQVAT